MFFSILKFWFSRLSRGWKGKKWPRMTKIPACRTLYFMNYISYDLDLWYTCMYKRIIPPGIFLFLLNFFSKFWFLGSLGGWGEGGGGVLVKGQKITQNDKKFCLCHSVSQELYIISWFLVHICKMMISQQLFSFSKILILGVFREVKGQKMTKSYQFQYVLLYISGTVDHIVKILIVISTGVFLYFFENQHGKY